MCPWASVIDHRSRLPGGGVGGLLEGRDSAQEKYWSPLA